MTVMQLILLSVDDDESNQTANGTAVVPDSENVDHSSDSDGDVDDSRGILPDDLRESFEAVKAAWRQSRRASAEEAEELRRKEREIAVETALGVDAEISRWQNGIAELEALLAQEDQDGEGVGDESNNDAGRQQQQQAGILRFPSLPPVVPPEDDDDDENIGGEFAATTNP